METTRRRKGLSGKARRVRERNRAARLHAKRLIQEYCESDPVVQAPIRYIPIRHTTAFRPTVAISKPTEPQKKPSRGTSVKAAASTQDTAERHTTPAGRHVGTQPDKALQLSCRSPASGTATSARAAIFGRRKAFRLDRFLLGCALGTAAASILLICVRTAIG